MRNRKIKQQRKPRKERVEIVRARSTTKLVVEGVIAILVVGAVVALTACMYLAH